MHGKNIKKQQRKDVTQKPVWGTLFSALPDNKIDCLKWQDKVER